MTFSWYALTLFLIPIFAPAETREYIGNRMSTAFIFRMSIYLVTSEGRTPISRIVFQPPIPPAGNQERPPDKEKVQPHLLHQAITDMITQVEEIGQVSNMQQLTDA